MRKIAMALDKLVNIAVFIGHTCFIIIDFLATLSDFIIFSKGYY